MEGSDEAQPHKTRDLLSSAPETLLTKNPPKPSRAKIWCLVGNAGMDAYSRPDILPNSSLYNPFPHSLLRTRQKIQNSNGNNNKNYYDHYYYYDY